MAFFTRKGFTVPELPHEGTLTEEPEPIGSQSSTSTQCRQLNRISASQHSSGDGSDDENCESIRMHSTGGGGGGVSSPETATNVAKSDGNDVEKFDYVIDRTYGVEV